MTAIEDLVRDYRAAFLWYLARRQETALSAGYDLGRAALASELSLLDVVRVHHEVLIEVLGNSRPGEVAEIAGAASNFLMEVLASYDMARRGSPRGG